MGRLRAKPDKCTGCNLCLLACSFNFTSEFNPRLALMRVERRRDGLLFQPVTCEQCENAFCLRVCPSKAVSREDILKIDANNCTGCGLCAEYCPWKVIILREGTAYKCDLCQGQPECVKVCPAGALELEAV